MKPEDPYGFGGRSELIDLSVVIVSWNTREVLLSCLESIFLSRKRISLELIVVDNGSQDGGGREAKRTFPTLHLIENQRNEGFAKAANQGLKKSEGRYILLLNPDTKMKRGAMEQLVSFMDAHVDAGVAGGQLFNRDHSKQNSIANFPSLATELLNKSLLRQFFPNKFPGKERNYPEPIEVDSVIGACIIIRREAMEQVGTLDEDYFLFLEETDWCYRMKRRGWKVYHIPQAEVYHDQGKSAETEKKKARVEYYRSRYIFFKKNRDGFQWFILLLGLVIRLGVQLLGMALACLFTLFMIQRWRKRFFLSVYLMEWHLRGCPKGMGLKETK